MTIDLYAQRRLRLANAMLAHGGGVALLPAAPERERNGGSFYSYRYDSNQYYLCGFAEPEALLAVIARTGQPPETVLFCRDKNPERELWEGERCGPVAALARYGVERSFALEEIDRRLPELLANQQAVYCALGVDGDFDARLQQWLTAVRAMGRNGTQAPASVRDVRTLLDEMRLFKDAHEIDTMRRAAGISAGAHRRAMQACRPGLFEYQLEAALQHEFTLRGAQAPAYGSIVAGGANANVLHYVDNRQPLRDGELVLIDAGCELDGYASDITRTFPVNGRFSTPQRALYELVLAAQHAAIATIRPGAHWNAPHEAAVAVLVQGMCDLGLLPGTPAEALESGSYRKFYMHRTGHWLGLDVHDVGDYRQPGAAPNDGSERPWRLLQPGMMLTVEPGLYVRAEAGIPEQFHNIGIRIEDDALVTETACDIITRDVPTDADAIETLMRQHD